MFAFPIIIFMLLFIPGFLLLAGMDSLMHKGPAGWFGAGMLLGGSILGTKILIEKTKAWWKATDGKWAKEKQKF